MAKAGGIRNPGLNQGDFKSVGIIGWRGDTLWIHDPAQSRISFITRDRLVVRTLQIPSTISARNSSDTSAPVSLQESTFRGVTPDGSLLFEIPERVKSSWWPSGASIASNVVVVNPIGQFVRHVVEIPAERASCVRTVTQSGQASATFSVPFCSGDLHHITPDRVIFVRSQPNPAGGAGYRVTSVDLLGDTTFTRVFGYEPRPLLKRLGDSAKKALQSTKGISPELKKAYSSLELLHVSPPVLRILSGVDGAVWLERPAKPDTLHNWLVLDQMGATTAEVELPGTDIVFAARRNIAWGIYTRPRIPSPDNPFLFGRWGIVMSPALARPKP